MKFGKLGIIIQVMLTALTYSQTYVPPGDVSGTWSLNNSPYYIQGDIIIPNDSTLIIEPGVLVEFQGHYALNVQGQLLAIGTVSNKIIFTINDTTGFYNPNTNQGGWNGIQFIDTPAENDTSKFIYCILQYGKAVGSNHPDNSGGALFISNFNKVLISNSLITYNSAGGTDSPSGGGISLFGANITLNDNEISHNFAFNGGGILIWESDPVFINNETIYNKAGQAGGGIWVGGLSKPVFNGDNISSNVAEVDGGGIICWQTTNTIFNYADISRNTAYNGGGAIFIECEAQFNWCNVSDNSAGGSGGGIFSDMSTIEVNNTTLEGDTSSLFGGAIFNSNSSVNINDCNLINNGTVIRGGAIHSTFSVLNISNTTFERDTANIFGGAIATEHTEMFLNNCNLIENSAGILGGAIHSDLSDLNIINSFFTRDTAGNAGGAVFNWLCQTQISNCSFNENASFNGGAISSSNTSLLIDSCWFYQNLCQNQGGAIEFISDTSNFVSTCALEIIDSKFEENSSFTRCGVALIEQYNSEEPLANVLIDKCEFINNNALRVGAIRIGGIKDFSLSNSKFIGNTVNLHTACCTFAGNSNGSINNTLFLRNIANSGSAGGAGISINSKVDFMNCTFANNCSGSGGAIHLRSGAQVILINTIMWGNLPDQISLNSVNDTSACLLYSNYNNIQYGIDSVHIIDSVSVINWGVGNIDEDPLFVDTLINDFHLKDLSPCIAAGIDSIELGGVWHNSPSTDIEGNPRPNPAGTQPDIGAYESSFPTGVEDGYTTLPEDYALYQNHPNPFNPSTMINWQSPVGSWQTIKLFNVLGIELETIVDGYYDAGDHSTLYIIDSELASGVYFYQFKAGDYVNTKKMILLK